MKEGPRLRPDLESEEACPADVLLELTLRPPPRLESLQVRVDARTVFQ